MTTKRTRLGKIVGSYKPPLAAFTYWPENNWATNDPGYVVVAPSGARVGWHANEVDAKSDVARRNAEWNA